MKKKTTIVDIANYLGITPSAVSKALSDHPRISKRTKKAVSKAVAKLGYRRNSLATALRKGRSGLIGVLVPGIHFSFFANAIKGIEETLSTEGYSVIIAQSQDRFGTEKKQLNGFVNAQVEGIIASLASETTDYNHFKQVTAGTPLVLFDRIIEGLEVSTVMIDDFLGATKAIDHLVEKGYKKIAHIAGYDHVGAFRKRIEGYKAAIEKNGLEIKEDFIIQCGLSKEDGHEITKKLMHLPERPDAIFASSDYPAFGAIKQLEALGLSIPEEVGVVGFSNEEYTSLVSPAISTIEQYSENMGVMAAKAMIDQLRRLSEQREHVPQRNILAPKLIIRTSSDR